MKYNLKYLADAFQAFFAGGGYLRFKSKYHTLDGFTIPSEVKVSDSHLYVLKAGWLRVKGHNTLCRLPTPTGSHPTGRDEIQAQVVCVYYLYRIHGLAVPRALFHFR